MSRQHLVVVPHTHWDREWHHTFEDFRYRLVGLVDGLLELLEGDPAFRHFTLDGQSIVVDDYLEVRPHARERIAKLVRDGRLLVGPWYVLPDEWLVSGEALIRNLRLGLRKARELGAAMSLGYVPDQFGHVGQLPQIFASFGFEAAALWRGVGADVEETTFTWEAPDGTRLFTVYLPFGYGNAERLPLEPDALADRLRRCAARLERFSRIPTLLLMNGSDHRPPQPGLPAALEAAAARLGGVSVEIGTLPGFVRRARREAPADAPLHRGELRSGLRAPLLPGCASARMPQKRRDFRLDGVLTRYIEPLAAWLAALGGEPDTDVIEHAWRLVLENHPHDSICGCSIDAVHEQIDARLARAETLTSAHLERIATQLAERVALPPAARGDHGDALVVWNPHAAGPALVDGELELDLSLGGRRESPFVKPFHLRDADGNALAAAAEVVDPGAEVLSLRLPARFHATLLRLLDGEIAGSFVRGVQLRRRGRRAELDLRLGTGPSGFDAAAVRARLDAWLAAGELDEVQLRGRRVPRLRLRFTDALPGFGVRAYRIAHGAAPGADAPRSGRRADGGAWLANAHWRVEVHADGRVDLRHAGSGAEIPDALRLVSEGDRGDEYNFDPVPDAERVDRPARLRVRLESAGGETGIRIDARYRVPRELAPDRRSRRRSRVALPVTLRLRLPGDLDRLELELELDNTARDHRLRLQIRAPFRAQRFEVESAFEVAERPIAPQPDSFGSAHPAERPIGATPQRSFATLDDGALALTVANRGGGEVEALADVGGSSGLALTLLRAVGWLSRGDLALRPGDAGPPLPTPGAQVPGVHRLAFALRLHPVGDARRSVEAHAFAHPPLPIRCDSERRDSERRDSERRDPASRGPEPLGDGARLLAVDDPELVISAFEPRAGGGSRVRLYEAGGRARAAALRFGVPGLRRVRIVDLAGGSGAAAPTDEVHDGPIDDGQIDDGESDGGQIHEDRHGPVLPVTLRPWQILSLQLD